MVVKNTLTDKINAAALRTAIFKLLFEMNQMGSCENGLLISRHQFCNKKEESTFICSLDEIIMLLSMMNVIPEGFEIKLIIADSKEED